MNGTDQGTMWTRLCHYLTEAQRAVSTLVERIKAGWRSHHRRMASDPRYVDAVSALLPAVVELIARDMRVQGVTEALVRAYVAIVRALSQQDDWPPDLDWPDA